MKMPDDIAALAEEVIEAARAAGCTIATAESCTGGLIAAALTSVPGSSEVVYGGFVTYANEAKTAMVGVPYALLRQFGAVSEEVARAMAEGAVAVAGTHVAIAVTGIAGPGGRSVEKPVGLVHLAVAGAGSTRHLRRTYDPAWSRDLIRLATVEDALRLLRTSIG